ETFVDFEHGLNLCIREVRAALNDDADTPRYIETLPKRGYRFIAPMDVAGSRTVPLTTSIRKPPRSPTAWRESTLRLTLGAGIVVALSLLVAFNVSGVRDRLLGKPPSPRIQSLAVLPLKNLSGDPEQDYFADGMTEQLTTNLGQISALRVISRTSAMHYKGTNKTLPEIARELHVDAVVEGSVERSGDQVRITAQLIDAPNDRHLWAKTYERDLRDVLTLQDEVAQAIANEIRIKLTPQERSLLGRARPVNAGAHEADLRGFYVLHGMTTEVAETSKVQAIEKAIGYFQ